MKQSNTTAALISAFELTAEKIAPIDFADFLHIMGQNTTDKTRSGFVDAEKLFSELWQVAAARTCPYTPPQTDPIIMTQRIGNMNDDNTATFFYGLETMKNALTIYCEIDQTAKITQTPQVSYDFDDFTDSTITSPLHQKDMLSFRYFIEKISSGDADLNEIALEFDEMLNKNRHALMLCRQCDRAYDDDWGEDADEAPAMNT